MALLPEPVMPSSVWNRSPRLTPSANLAIACGWSPAGWKSETTLEVGHDSQSRVTNTRSLSP